MKTFLNDLTCHSSFRACVYHIDDYCTSLVLVEFMNATPSRAKEVNPLLQVQQKLLAKSPQCFSNANCVSSCALQKHEHESSWLTDQQICQKLIQSRLMTSSSSKLLLQQHLNCPRKVVVSEQPTYVRRWMITCKFTDNHSMLQSRMDLYQQMVQEVILSTTTSWLAFWSSSHGTLPDQSMGGSGSLYSSLSSPQFQFSWAFGLWSLQFLLERTTKPNFQVVLSSITSPFEVQKIEQDILAETKFLWKHSMRCTLTRRLISKEIV